MKIIEHGPTNDEDWEMECICKNYGSYDETGCGTKVMISEMDIYRYLVSSGIDWDPDEYGYQYVCPECGKQVRIKDNLIPAVNRKHIEFRYSDSNHWKTSDIERNNLHNEIRARWIKERTERMKTKLLQRKESYGG